MISKNTPGVVPRLHGLTQLTALFMSDDEIDALVAELAADGIVVTKDEAERAVHRLAELLLLISQPLPFHPSLDVTLDSQDPPPAPTEQGPLLGE